MVVMTKKMIIIKMVRVIMFVIITDVGVAKTLGWVGTIRAR